MSNLIMWIATAVLALAAAKVMVTAAPAPAPAPEIDHQTEALAKKMMAILYDKRSLDEDSYSFEVETSDGQYRKEVGTILNRGTKDETKVVIGQYAYKDAFGKQQHYMYVADKNGYRVMRVEYSYKFEPTLYPLPSSFSKHNENLNKAVLSLLGQG